MAALSPLLRGKRLSLLPDCFWIIYRTGHWLWLDFYNTAEQSAPRLLRHKAPHIKKEQHKEVATEGGAGCEQIVALSRWLHKSTHYALWDWQCNAFQRLNVNAILCWEWPVHSRFSFLWWLVVCDSNSNKDEDSSRHQNDFNNSGGKNERRQDRKCCSI